MSEQLPDIPPTRRRRAAEPVAAEPGTERVTPDLDAVNDAITRPPAPRLEAPSSDVAAVPAASRIPGAPKDGYHQLPTAPVVTTPADPGADDGDAWEPTTGAVAVAPRPIVSGWGLGVAIVALVASVLVGWMLPLGVIAIVIAIVALRRPGESRPLAVWALVLGALAVVYSAGWLLWALPQLSAA